MNEGWFPYDSEIERNVLGAFMTDMDVVNEHIPKCFSDMFYSTQYKTIFESIQYLSQKGINVDIISVKKRLQEIDRLGFIGGQLTLAECVRSSSSRIEYYITVLKELYIRRRQIVMGKKFAEEAVNPTVDVFDTMTTVESFINEINQNIIGDSYNFDINSETERVYKYMMAPKNERHTGLKTGNGSLTGIIGGFNPGELYYLAARPGMGKTTRALQFALEVAFNDNQVDIYSLEMTKDELIKKMLLNVSDLESQLVSNHSWTSDQMDLYYQAAERLKKSPIHINDTGFLKPKDLRTIGHQRKRNKGTKMIIIDYIQIMSPDIDYRGNKEREVGSISTSLKRLAKELHIPILVLVQLSRECEKRNNKRPMLSDMRDTGQLEQDADVVMSLYSPCIYDDYGHAEDQYHNLSEEQYLQVSELTVLKNRNGIPNVVIPEKFIRNKSLFKP